MLAEKRLILLVGSAPVLGDQLKQVVGDLGLGEMLDQLSDLPRSSSIDTGRTVLVTSFDSDTWW